MSVVASTSLFVPDRHRRDVPDTATRHSDPDASLRTVALPCSAPYSINIVFIPCIPGSTAPGHLRAALSWSEHSFSSPDPTLVDALTAIHMFEVNRNEKYGFLNANKAWNSRAQH
ncbi:hypothetical protein L596_021020 [Steinernema carpocapsae]|uniref:Uncharacterized protein n=1 Tax=Steinernema carpocapsae TaxID=34508 RepID=A0A4U5MVG7_STECR|nr:hypothetical protein L596_021020 [Steinernema carpocapsae]